MSAVALHGRRVAAVLWDGVLFIWPLVMIVGGVALATFFVIVVSLRWHHGIYAGFHYDGARNVAVRSLIVKYGRDEAAQFRFADPPVVNTHSSSLFVDGQIRVFHLYGPRGSRYCVSVWDPGRYWTGRDQSGVNIGGETTIKKGCTF